jgi:DNA-directed RNA polymerase specialized sigma24 family protein
MSSDRLDQQLTECRRISILEARRRGLSADDADDLAQEICLKLWAILSTPEDPSKPGKRPKHIPAWTRTATANLIIDTHRRERAAKYGGGLLESLSGYDDELSRVT